MSQEKNLYFPIFYTACDNTDTLSDEEFGILIRALLKHGPTRTRPEDLHPLLISPYNFMLEAAVRVFDARGKSPNFSKNSAPPQYNAKKDTGIDYDAVYERALERTYGKK